MPEAYWPTHGQFRSRHGIACSPPGPIGRAKRVGYASRCCSRKHAGGLKVRGLFRSVDRAEFEFSVHDLARRETALRRFIDDPYASDSMRGMHPEDRAMLLDAPVGA